MNSITLIAMSDDWRLRVVLNEDASARELTDRLETFDQEHDLSTSFSDRVAVSRDGPEVFLYADTRDQMEAAEKAIQSLAAEHQWQLTRELRHWHPTAEEWEDPNEALPHTAAAIASERAKLMESERQESRVQGYPEYEVRVRCPSRRDAEQLAQRLRDEGIPCAQRWQFVVLGAPDEDSAELLADRVRREAPAGSTVTAEGSEQQAIGDAPLATPFSPFAVFGGFSG
jgi:hypothetical protein